MDSKDELIKQTSDAEDAASTEGNQKVTQGSSSSSALYDLTDLAVAIPALYERRKGGEYVDLTSQVEPVISTSDGDELIFHKGQDYTISFARLDDGGNATPVVEVTERGNYEATLVGIGNRLEGERVVPFSVYRPLRKGLLTLLVLLSLIGASLGIYMTLNAPEAPWLDPNAGEGLAGIHGDDLQELLNTQVAEGMMNITVLDYIIFPEGTLQPGEVGFNNLASNHYDQKLMITLNETGEVLYESGAIQPGQHIQFITLNRSFDPGIYEATASVTGYDHETHAEQGVLSAVVKIVVRDTANKTE